MDEQRIAERVEAVLRKHFGDVGDPNFNFEDEDFKEAAAAIVALFATAATPST